jgi:hypothetical protein
MCGGGLLQIIAYGASDHLLMCDDKLLFYGNSTTFNRGKVSRFRGKHNFYEHIKKPVNNFNKKSARINVTKSGMLIDEYDDISNNSRYITTIDSVHYPKIFNSDNVHISKGIYVNNNRKYRNFELLFKYNKFDYYEYASISLNNIFKTNS